MIGRRSWNWPIWAGFVLTLLAVASYVLVFVRYPITRDVPWATYLLFVVSLIFLLVGLWRAFGRASLYRGKIAGSILTVLSVGLMALFSYGTLHGSRVPPSNDAPKVGENAPDFSLPDTHGNTVTLATLLASPQDSTGKPPRALLLVFYRGYW